MRPSPGGTVRRRLLLALLLAGTLGAPARARGDALDLALDRLVPKPTHPGEFANPGGSFAAQADYRQLVSELGVALSPKFLTTADTIGYSGFQFTFDTSFTSLSSDTCNTTADVGCPYRGVQGTGPTGHVGVPSYATTVSVYARKGIWLPLPSFEIGAGATKLLQSDIFAVQVYAKFALHEGFHGWPLPSLSVRGSGLRVMGASQIDLTMAQVDVEVSKSFGILGTVTLTPYLGAAWLAIVARGQVLDITPEIDAYKQGPGSTDLNNNAVFPDQPRIDRWRYFGGFRLQYSILVLTADVAFTACGDYTGGACDHQKVMSDGKIPDRSPHQWTYSGSAGLLF